MFHFKPAETPSKSVKEDKQRGDAEQEADEVTPVVVGVVENTMPPSQKRAEGINGFRHHQNGKEIEEPVNVGYIVGDEVAGKGQHGCVDQHDKAGKPPQETLPQRETFLVTQIVEVKVKIGKHYQQQ